jgi:hypothetical protein
MSVTSNSDVRAWDEGSAAQPTVEPVQPQRGRRLRWLVAVVVSLLVIGAIALIFMLANPPAQGGLSALARYAPADTVAYVEARLDLPGDQRDRLVSFMSHFPGFADPANFERKISDTLDQALAGTGLGLSWSGDIDPWFGGQLVFFSNDVEESRGRPQAGVVALSVKDRAERDAFVARVTGGFETGEYRGTTILTGRLADERVSLASVDDALLLSARIEDLHAALDVAAGERDGLTAAPRFAAAMATLRGDRLLGMYLDGEAMISALGAIGENLPPDVEAQLRRAPGTVVGQLRTEAEHMLFEMRMQPRAGQTLPDLPANRSTQLAAAFATDVVGYGEVRDVGQGIRQMFDQFGDTLGDGGAPLPVDVEQLLGTDLESFFDFIGDAAIGVEVEGETIGAGMIALLTDEDVARQRIERLTAALRMAVAFGGADVPLAIDETTHGGARLTVVRVRGDDAGDLPFASLAYGVSGGRLYLGIDDFVTDALDRGNGAGLASDARYRSALTAAGESNGGIFYLNVSRVRSLLEDQLSQRERTDVAEFWPWFERFSHVMGTVVADGDDLLTRFVLFVE